MGRQHNAVSVAALYGASPAKRERRTRAQLSALEDRVFDVLERGYPMTLRGLYYRLVTLGDIEKTELAYKGLGRVVTQMRREEQLPFEWLVDGTRWMRKPRTHRSLGAMLDESARFYRRDLWIDQPTYVEVWSEKDAIAGVLFDSTDEWDVPLMVCRGYPSLTFLHSSAEAIRRQSKPAHLYYFGDHDPSGVDISRAVEAGIREFAPGADITFERLAVTRDQINVWQLPTRPTKQSDSRAARFAGESVEVDAIEPARLRELVSDAIEQHIDPATLERVKRVEAAERESLAGMAKAFRGDAA